MTMQYQCPHCAGLFQVDATMAGQQITCPSCGGLVTVPGTTAPMVEIAGGGITGGACLPPTQTLQQVGCAVCGNLMQVDLSLAGQQTGCPACGALMTIPRPASPDGLPSSTPTPPPAQTNTLPQSISPAPAAPPAGPQPPQAAPSAADAPPANFPNPNPNPAPSADTGEGDRIPDNETVETAWTPPRAKADKTGETSQRGSQDGNLAARSPRASASPSSTFDETGADISHLMPPDLSGNASKTSKATPTTKSSSAGGREAPEPAPGPPPDGAALLPPHLDPVTGKPKHARVAGSPDKRVAETRPDVIESPLAVTEPVKTVGVGEQERELQTLSRREKEGRRNLTSMIMFIVGFVILGATLFLLNMSSCVAIRLE